MDSLLRYLPAEVERRLLPYMDTAREIRLMSTGVTAVVTDRGIVDVEAPVTALQIKNILNFICRGAVYSSQNTLKEGFVTIEGGHRVGVCGRISGETMLEPSALCFRIAREVPGAAEKIEKYLDGSALIISPPGCGKTTMLRDAARILGQRRPVCVVDERSEIAAAVHGVPGLDVGRYTCVLDGVKKSKGMLMALRTLSPRYIITDEIGSDEDCEAVYALADAGVSLITSVHGYGPSDAARRGRLGELMEKGLFASIITLRGLGEVKEVVRGGRA